MDGERENIQADIDELRKYAKLMTAALTRVSGLAYARVLATRDSLVNQAEQMQARLDAFRDPRDDL